MKLIYHFQSIGCCSLNAGNSMHIGSVAALSENCTTLMEGMAAVGGAMAAVGGAMAAVGGAMAAVGGAMACSWWCNGMQLVVQWQQLVVQWPAVGGAMACSWWCNGSSWWCNGSSWWQDRVWTHLLWEAKNRVCQQRHLGDEFWQILPLFQTSSDSRHFGLRKFFQ